MMSSNAAPRPTAPWVEPGSIGHAAWHRFRNAGPVSSSTSIAVALSHAMAPYDRQNDFLSSLSIRQFAPSNPLAGRWANDGLILHRKLSTRFTSALDRTAIEPYDEARASIGARSTRSRTLPAGNAEVFAAGDRASAIGNIELDSAGHESVDTAATRGRDALSEPLTMPFSGASTGPLGVAVSTAVARGFEPGGAAVAVPLSRGGSLRASSRLESESLHEPGRPRSERVSESTAASVRAPTPNDPPEPIIRDMGNSDTPVPALALPLSHSSLRASLAEPESLHEPVALARMPMPKEPPDLIVRDADHPDGRAAAGALPLSHSESPRVSRPSELASLHEQERPRADGVRESRAESLRNSGPESLREAASASLREPTMTLTRTPTPSESPSPSSRETSMPAGEAPARTFTPSTTVSTAIESSSTAMAAAPTATSRHSMPQGANGDDPLIRSVRAPLTFSSDRLSLSNAVDGTVNRSPKTVVQRHASANPIGNRSEPANNEAGAVRETLARAVPASAPMAMPLSRYAAVFPPAPLAAASSTVVAREAAAALSPASIPSRDISVHADSSRNHPNPAASNPEVSVDDSHVSPVGAVTGIDSSLSAAAPSMQFSRHLAMAFTLPASRGYPTLSDTALSQATADSAFSMPAQATSGTQDRISRTHRSSGAAMNGPLTSALLNPSDLSGESDLPGGSGALIGSSMMGGSDRSTTPSATATAYTRRDARPTAMPLSRSAMEFSRPDLAAARAGLGGSMDLGMRESGPRVPTASVVFRSTGTPQGFDSADRSQGTVARSEAAAQRWVRTPDESVTAESADLVASGISASSANGALSGIAASRVNGASSGSSASGENLAWSGNAASSADAASGADTAGGNRSVSSAWPFTVSGKGWPAMNLLRLAPAMRSTGPPHRPTESAVPGPGRVLQRAVSPVASMPPPPAAGLPPAPDAGDLLSGAHATGPSAAGLSTTANASNAQAAQAAGGDIDDIVDRALQALMMRLTIEKERRGFGRWA